MILVDFSQIMVSNAMINMDKKETTVNEDLLRHQILNSLRQIKVDYGKEFGEMVICADDRHYWRRDIFPYYKALRKESRDESPIDWQQVYGVLNKIRDEIKDNFPYRVIRVEKAEADDVIGVLTKEFGVQLMNDDSEKILIVSSDKDFQQLQKYANVKQWSTIQKKWVRVDDPHAYLKEHIIRGDRGDGVPNILSEDSAIVSHSRQSPILSKKLEKWLNQEPQDFCEGDMLRNYKRNEQLVDLEQVPDEIAQEILDKYYNYNIPKKNGLLNYFIKNRLKNLMEVIGDF